MSEWSEGFQHESIATDEQRANFNTAMGKYASQDEALMGGYNAMKMTGSPFKIPESMDKLPSDASRADFSTQAYKALGVEHAGSIDDLAELDIKAGMGEGLEANEGFVKSFKQFVVDNKISKANAQKLLGFYNESQAQQMTAYTEKQETDRNAKAEEVNAELDKHFGTHEEVVKQSELFKRAIRNNVGLTNEEAEEFADAMIDAGLTQNAVLARVMLKQFAPLAAEGSSHSGDGHGGGDGAGITPYEFKKQLHPNSDSLWGKPGDSWENESIGLRKRAGVK